MPSILSDAYGYHIYFWSNEGEPLEPIHFHISKHPHKNATKIWVLKDGSLEICNNNDDIPTNELKRILRLMSLPINIERTKKKWIDHFDEISYLK